MSKTGFPLTERFSQAMVYAHRLHKGQYRKKSGVPYVAHLLAVASLVLEAGAEEDEALAALLHDAAEDQGGEATLAEIEERFGSRVAAIVRDCSDTFETPKPPWEPRKQAHLDHLRSAADTSTLLVVAADKLHNARDTLEAFRSEGPAVWDRFHASREQTLWFYREVEEILLGADDERVSELGLRLGEVVDALELTSEDAAVVTPSYEEPTAPRAARSGTPTSRKGTKSKARRSAAPKRRKSGESKAAPTGSSTRRKANAAKAPRAGKQTLRKATESRPSRTASSKRPKSTGSSASRAASSTRSKASESRASRTPTPTRPKASESRASRAPSSKRPKSHQSRAPRAATPSKSGEPRASRAAAPAQPQPHELVPGAILTRLDAVLSRLARGNTSDARKSIQDLQRELSTAILPDSLQQRAEADAALALEILDGDGPHLAARAASRLGTLREILTEAEETSG